MTTAVEPLSLPGVVAPPVTRAATKAAGDFFETPAPITQAVWRSLYPRGLPGLDVLDPCAGRGAILQAIDRSEASRHVQGPKLRGIELDVGRAIECQRLHRCEVADAFTVDWGRPDLVVMNPPFCLAQEFVEAALARVTPGGSVVALLRLAFLESAKRVPFHKAQPSTVLILSSRPSLTANGKTDSSAYAWFVFEPGVKREWEILEVGR